MSYPQRLLILLLATLLACQSDPPADDAGLMDAELGSPEAVVRRYQHYVDNNQFEAAKALSTAAEQQRLQDMAFVIQNMEDPDSSILQTRFLSIDCQEPSDSTAVCACRLQDQYETYSTQFELLRRDGQWLVQPPPMEKDGPDMDAIEQMMDSLTQQDS